MNKNYQSYKDTWHILNQAIGLLAVNRGDIRIRLVNAYVYHLFKLEADGFPSELRKQFKWVKSQLINEERLKQYQHRGNLIDQVKRSLYRRKSKTLERIAEAILEIHARLGAHLEYLIKNCKS